MDDVAQGNLLNRKENWIFNLSFWFLNEAFSIFLEWNRALVHVQYFFLLGQNYSDTSNSIPECVSA